MESGPQIAVKSFFELLCLKSVLTLVILCLLPKILQIENHCNLIIKRACKKFKFFRNSNSGSLSILNNLMKNNFLASLNKK